METKNRAMAIMVMKDDLLVRAKVLLSQINEVYEFPKVGSWLQKYEGMMKAVMDEA